MVHISIGASGVTQADVKKIMAAHGPVTVHHSSCATIAGRRSMALVLKQSGCDHDVANRLGWGTCDPTPPPTPPRPKQKRARDPKPGIICR